MPTRYVIKPRASVSATLVSVDVTAHNVCRVIGASPTARSANVTATRMCATKHQANVLIVLTIQKANTVRNVPMGTTAMLDSSLASLSHVPHVRVPKGLDQDVSLRHRVTEAHPCHVTTAKLATP